GLPTLPRRGQRPRHQITQVGATLVPRTRTLRLHRMTTGACLGVDGDGVAAHWRLTECPSFDAKGNHIAATRDFERWDGVLFDDPEKTESRIPKGNSPLPKGIHTGGSKRARKRSKRIPKGNIDSAPSMLPKGVHNCLPPPTALKPRPRYPKATATQAYAGYTSLPLELRLMALGLPVNGAARLSALGTA